MKKKWQPGTAVMLIDEMVKAAVIKQINDRVWILTEEGFELECNATDLVLDQSMQVTQAPIKSSDLPKKPKAPTSDKHRLVIDLHLHQLIEDDRHLMPYEKLQLQLNTAEQALLTAYRKKIDTVVLIHGMGSGKLREALKSVYAKFEGIAFYDAAYAEFGRGATEVKLYLQRFKWKD